MPQKAIKGLARAGIVSAILALASAAPAVEPNSLRALKSGTDAMELSWSDPDPTVFCIQRGSTPRFLLLQDSTAGLSYVDTPPAGSLWFYSVTEPASGDCNVPSETEVCDRWNQDYPTQSLDVYDGPVSGCEHGTVDPVAIEDAVRRTNLYRWLLGLPPIVERSDYSYNAQAASVIMRGLGGLTHDPQPGDPCYTAEGDSGAGSSNICRNCSSPASAVDTYIRDSGVDSLGHRRWIFHPPYAEAGFGFVEGGGTWSAQWVFGWGPDPDPEYVAYPPPAPFPVAGLMGHWSFAVAGADFSSATVEVTRLSDGTPMTVTGVYEPARGFGLNTVAWDAAGTEAGEQYEIFVNNVNSAPMRSYIYVTTLIDCR